MTSLIRVRILVVAVLASTACASLPIGTAAEPTVIAVRNRSGADIATVTLRQQKTSSYQSIRFGSVSPVPAGVTQSVGRPANPPRMAGTVTLEWIDGQGRTHSREIPVRQALKTATGAVGETLVFEIGPFEDVQVFVEPPAAAEPSDQSAGRDR